MRLSFKRNAAIRTSVIWIIGAICCLMQPGLSFAELKEEWHSHYVHRGQVEDYEVDDLGNIYICGWYWEDTINNNNSNGFVLSFDADGNFRWFDAFDGGDDLAVDSLTNQWTDGALELEIGNNGLIYVAGTSSRYIGDIECPDGGGESWGFASVLRFIGYSLQGGRLFDVTSNPSCGANSFNTGSAAPPAATDMLVDAGGNAHFLYNSLSICTPAGNVTDILAWYETDEFNPQGAGPYKWARGIGLDGSGNNYILGVLQSDGPREVGVQKLSQFGGPQWTTTLPESEYGSMECLATDNLGNSYAVFLPPWSSTGRTIIKFSSGGGISFTAPPHVDSTILQMECDNAGHLLINARGHILVHSTENGQFLWDAPNSFFFQIGSEGDVYVSGNPYESARRYTADGTLIWEASEINLLHGNSYYNSQFRVGSDGCIYQAGAVGDTIWAEKLSQQKVFTIRDINNDTIPDVEFTMIKVTNDKPDYTEDTLGTFRTDSLGNIFCDYLATDSFLFATDEFDIEPDTIVIDDTLKISRLITDSAAVKHSGVLGTMYSLHLDNIKFDEQGGLVFDTVEGTRQDIFMDHTEIRYNLLVSVEWDASENYLYSLEDNFRGMSNYLYDVTDGQVRLDTVMIFDDANHWLEADMRIHSSNMEWPRANLYGIYSSDQRIVFMPRKWYSDVRNHTYYNHPLNMNEPIDYRTKVHETGHYAFGFYDEYLYLDPADVDSATFVNDPALRCSQVSNYGFMQSQYPGADPYRSEMSSIYHYQETGCRNTKQFIINNSSCWDHFESNFEGLYLNDTFYVPIIMANDSARTSYPGLPYCPGPNNDLTSPEALDYDVGYKIEFPNSPSPPAVGIKNVDAEIMVSGAIVANAEVSLFKQNIDQTWYSIKQGNTADNGRIWVLGAKAGDEVRSVGTRQIVTRAVSAVNEEWLYGSSVVDGDSLTVDMVAVNGNFPLICGVSLADKSGTFTLTSETGFPSTPSLTYRPSSGGEYRFDFSSMGEGYEVFIGQNPGSYGTATIEAEDDSANIFFFINDYTFAEFAPTADIKELFGPSGESQISFNTDNPTLEQAMLLSSPYLIIRTGLSDVNIQASKTHSLSVYPDGSMTGDGLFRILYSEDNIISRGGSAADEVSLKIFKWIDMVTGWQEVGGTVDTALNQVIETITEPGVYAAFTTEGPVDAGDDLGYTLPYRFEVLQNYPNPFNPVTTITYSLARQCHVNIDVYNILGQKVRSLVDREESAGSYSITWDGTNDAGRSVATGVYLYRFQAGGHIETRKMLLLK